MNDLKQVVSLRLRREVLKIFNNSQQREELLVLMGDDVTIEDLIKRVIQYTLGIGSLENNYYSTFLSRLVLHVHNIFNTSYHFTRQNIVLKLLQDLIPSSIVEIGYGVPTKYTFSSIFNRNTTVTLLDKYHSGVEFSKKIFDYRLINWKDRIFLDYYDMDSGNYMGDNDVYVFLDSIEHAKNPTKYLKSIVNKAPNDSHFIFSLPICRIDSLQKLHFIEWETDKAAEEWLMSCGLRVEKRFSIYPNEEIDLFTQLIDRNFYSYLVLCKKQVRKVF